jgi:hypothetical protein
MSQEFTAPSAPDATSSPVAPASAARIISIDAQRGFDMFWIIGGKHFFLSLAAVWCLPQPVPEWLKTTMEHTRWGGFRAPQT